MKTVFVLQHEHERLDREDVKFIGVYDSRSAAESAVRRLHDQPGFRDSRDGFSIDEYELGRDHWMEGFVVSVNIMVPLINEDGQHVGAGSTWHPGDLYEITDVDQGVDSSSLKFGVGDWVRCEEKDLADGRCLVAVARHHSQADPSGAKP